MVERQRYLARIRESLARSAVVMLVGPRQCGTTTLARQLLPAEAPSFFDLEHPAVEALLAQPLTALHDLGGSRSETPII